MSEYRSVLERAASNFAPLDLPLERVERGRDRRGRNRRIAAGVVGIAVFVAAVWIVTSVGSLDRSETSVVPGGNVTGRVEPGPADGVTGLPGPYAGLRSCSDGAKVGLDLALGGGGFAVLLEIHRSPIGDKWRIKMWHDGRLFYAKTKVASDSGDVIANPLSNRGQHPDSVRAHAVDTSTGETCIARATT